ncbi:polysaccharide pyruvyl transferase family protein [Jeotgalibacillus soli]|uniref:Polysaccharide pyruvyl transferase domain-containing protein n=1 Tax=Jeotgalibacillus soli TaxID=889306 RepID=A0A0C2VZI3_9BACL|nr:polysaccharide pyruvyl transferase family protein [Jeotgalibacillus soli]KIL49363.1 hypothetical protein KP78_08310 [Jeotgalibacillus soli]
MEKKILVCAYYAKNIGDDLFLKILFDRYTNVQWDLLTANRNYKHIFKDYKNVNIIYTYRDISFGSKRYNLFFKINDLFLKYKKYDSLINIGGSIFMQSPAWKMKLNERDYLVNHFRRMNKKTFVLGANFGPYKDDIFVEKYHSLFKKYDDICFRDLYSYNLFKDLDNVRLAPDIVFSLNDKRNKKKEKCAGFSIIDIEKREGLKEYKAHYNKKIVHLIQEYVDQGYEIKLFSFCENEGDLEAIKIIADKISDRNIDNVKIINYQGNIDKFLDEFYSCEIIVGTRFHSVILALLNDQGVFPIIYSDKTYNVLKDLDMEGNSNYIKDLDGLDIKNAVAASKHHKIKNKNILLEAEKQFEKLDLFLEKIN